MNFEFVLTNTVNNDLQNVGEIRFEYTELVQLTSRTSKVFF